MAVSRLENFYEELKRRRVIRVATLYVVAIWPIIQLLDIVSPTLNLPETVLNYLVIAFFAGLPFALILAWIFDVDRDGIRLDDGQEHEPLLGSRVDLTIVGVLCLLVVALFIVQMAMEEESPQVVSTGEVQLTPDTPVTAPGTSIAVKPFDSFSTDPSDQFFADGLSEELLNVLARIPDLHVAARTSSFAYKGVNKNISEIGRELNVANILEGSVRANDVNNTIRVTAQLIDVATGAHIWSETYTHQYNDVFRIQDEISAAVAERLKVTLVGTSNSPESGDVVRTTNPEALIAYGQGQQELAKRSEQSLLAAQELFQRAIDNDDTFALAYAGLADAASLQVSYGIGDQDELLGIAESAVEKALALDSQLGIAWASKGLLVSQDKTRSDEARGYLERAMQLNPSYAMAVMWYASMEEDDAKKLSLYERAVDLDPKSPVAAFNLASMYSAQGRDAEVMQLFGQMVEADPNYSRAYSLVGQVSAKNGQLGEAIRYYQKAYELGGDANLALSIGKMYADLGEFENSDIWFERATVFVPEQFRKRILWFQLGRFLAAGENEIARQMLFDIRTKESDDLEDDLNKLLANYYLGERDSMVVDYLDAMNSGRVIAEDDSYAGDLRIRVYIAVADQMMTEGDQARAEDLLVKAEDMLNEKLSNPNRYWPDDRYHLARIAAVRGQDQLALILLQRAVDQGWREYWRPINDPAMQNIQADRFFLTMMAGLENRLAIIRDQLELEAEFAMGS